MLLSKVDIDVPLESDAEIFSELGFVGLLIWLIYAEREASENEFVATISETFDTPGNFKFPDTLRMNELINALQIPLGELEEVINLIKNPMGESLKYLIENIYQLLEEVFEERRKNLEKIPESLQVIATRLEEQILSNCNENIKLASNIKIFCGEVFEAMDQRDSESYFEDCINDITSSEFLLLLFNANLSKEDTSYANWVLGLQDKLSRLESHPSRLAVVFSHFDHPNIYSYRNNLNSLIAARFPATKLAIETWITDENSLAYFACSAFGMLNGTDKPNAIYRSSSTGGYLGSGTLKNPDIWQPFGVISPIYWILTGEYDERLLNF
jgi:predicted RNase H-like HicB family nuclease